MSRLFSVSLAALMVLVTLFGSVQPNVSANIATPEVIPTEESTAPIAVDQEQAVEEPMPDTPAPSVEPTEVIEEGLPPAPAEEPAEDANAPPADAETDAVVDEPVADPTDEPAAEPAIITNDAELAPVSDGEGEIAEPSTPEAGLISPSAVDPEPGDCPIDEVCDGGGGGGDIQPVTVTITVTQSGTLSDGATVVVRSADNADGDTKVTGANGIVEFELTAGATYLVDVTKTGYKPQTGFSLVVSEESSSITINLLPAFGRVSVSVTDAVTGDPVRYAIVRFTGKPGTNFRVNTNSGSTGQISPSMDSGEYVAFFSHPDYVSQQFDVTVIVGDSISVQLVPEAQEPVPTVLSLEVVDKTTGDPIPNATVTLRTPTSPFEIVREGTTDANGRWNSSPVEDVAYDLVILSPSHRTYFESLTSIPTSVRTIELISGPELTATYTVVDFESNEPVEKASITVKEYYTDTQVAAGQTDSNGNWTFDPIQGNGYRITIEKDGYETFKTYTYVSNSYSKTVELMTPGYPGSITFDIYDADSGQRIPGATITLSNGAVTETIITDESGKASLESVASGTYDITIEANGYTSYVGTGTISPNRTHNATYDLEPRPAATVVVQLQAPGEGAQLHVSSLGLSTTFGASGIAVNQISGAMLPVAGASVHLVNPDTGLVIAEGVTDDDGLVTIPVVRQGTYQLNISVAGYEDYSTPYEITEDAELTITLQPIGSTNPDVPGNPTTPEPGDGDDDQTPTTPEPGDGDDPTPTTPEPGDSDEETPTTPDPGDGDDEETPTTPEPGDGDVDQNPTDGSIDPDAVAETGSDATSGSTASAGTSTNTGSGDSERVSVSELPSTGSGPARSNGMLSALLILAGVTLLLATADRKRTR